MEQAKVTHKSVSNPNVVKTTVGTVTYDGAKYVCIKPGRSREVTIHRTEIVSIEPA